MRDCRGGSGEALLLFQSVNELIATGLKLKCLGAVTKARVLRWVIGCSPTMRTATPTYLSLRIVKGKIVDSKERANSLLLGILELR